MSQEQKSLQESIVSFKTSLTHALLLYTLLEIAEENLGRKKIFSNYQVKRIERLKLDEEIKAIDFEIQMMVDFQRFLYQELTDLKFNILSFCSTDEISQEYLIESGLNSEEDGDLVWRDFCIVLNKKGLALKIEATLDCQSKTVRVFCDDCEESNKQGAYFYVQETTDLFKLHEFAAKIINEINIRWKQVYKQKKIPQILEREESFRNLKSFAINKLKNSEFVIMNKEPVLRYTANGLAREFVINLSQNGEYFSLKMEISLKTEEVKITCQKPGSKEVLHEQNFLNCQEAQENLEQIIQQIKA